MLARTAVLRLLLENRQPFWLAGKHLTIRCLQGTVWVTSEHLPGDHFLQPGQSLTLPGKHRALIEGSSHAIVNIREGQNTWRNMLTGKTQDQKPAIMSA